MTEIIEGGSTIEIQESRPVLQVTPPVLMGPPGQPGLTWRHGEGVPDDEVEARVGDFYIDILTYDVYHKEWLGESAIWALKFNIKGAKGDPGLTVYVESVAWSGDDIVFSLSDDSSIALVGARTLLTGPAGPGLSVQYSADTSSWSSVFTEGCLYMRISNNGGLTWGTPIRFVGEDGMTHVVGGLTLGRAMALFG